MKLITKVATLTQDRELLEQYFTLRQSFFDQRDRDMRKSGVKPVSDEEAAPAAADGEKWPIKFDDRAEFLLAVDESANPPKVMGGLRLSRYRPGTEVPADKVEAARPERLFGIPDIRETKNILYVDGAVLEQESRLGLRTIVDTLLGGMVTKARADKVDAVMMIPGLKFAEQVISYFDPQPTGILRRMLPPRYVEDGNPTRIPVTDFGNVTYKNRVRVDVTKPVYGIIQDAQLRAIASEPHLRAAAGVDVARQAMGGRG